MTCVSQVSGGNISLLEISFVLTNLTDAAYNRLLLTRLSLCKKRAQANLAWALFF